MIALLLGLAQAQTANATHEEVAQMLEDLIPRVEAHAGRSFGADHPDFAFSWHNKLWPHIQSILAASRPAGELTQAELKAARMHLEGSVALYLESEDRIYVMADGVYELFEGADARDELFKPLLECTLAHELTHALQAREGSLETSPAGSSSAIAVHAALEGHANWVARQVCRELELEAVIGLMDGGQGIFALRAQGASMPTTALMYGASREWMDQLHATGGTDAQWQALVAPPEVTNWLGPTLAMLPEPPVSLSTLDAATQALDDGFWRMGTQGSMQIFGMLGDEGLRGIPQLTASWAAVHQGEDQRIVMAMFAFDQTDIPLSLIDAREQRPLQRPPGMPDQQGYRYDIRPRFARLSRATWVDRAARWSVRSYGTGWWEYWAARGDVLVVVLVQGDPLPVRTIVESVRIALDG